MKHIDVKDTAKMIRDALKQCFPGVKFSVKSSRYAGGASINVSWTDGPSAALVDQITGRFSGAYFDGMTDYKGTKTHTVNGERVRFGADYVFTRREFSDELIQKSINAVWSKYPTETVKPSVSDYRLGKLWQSHPVGERGMESCLQARIRDNAVKRSAVAAPAPSAVVDSIRYVGDDGYGECATGKVNHLKVVK